MNTMDPSESRQTRDIREVLASMVLQVVQEGVVIVSCIEAEDDQGRDTNRQDEGQDRPDRARDGDRDEGR